MVFIRAPDHHTLHLSNSKKHLHIGLKVSVAPWRTTELERLSQCTDLHCALLALKLMPALDPGDAFLNRAPVLRGQWRLHKHLQANRVQHTELSPTSPAAWVVGHQMLLSFPTGQFLPRGEGCGPVLAP